MDVINEGLRLWTTGGNREQNRMTHEQARKELLKRYQSVESTLRWTDLDYWSEQLGLDIPELKCKVDHLIQAPPLRP